MQEAYFGLWRAVQHYETSENVLFMTYAAYWIRQSVQRYLEKCGSIVRIPSHTRQKIIRYKKIVQDLEQELSRIPTDNEIAARMGISIELLPELKIQMQEVLDKTYAEYSKNELWGIVARFTNARENYIIREIFINNQILAVVAKKQNLSIDRIRQIKEKGLRKLRIGKAKRELLEKFDILEAGEYRNSMNKFNEHGFTSTVEYIAIRRAEIQAEYEEHKKWVETMFEQRERKYL